MFVQNLLSVIILMIFIIMVRVRMMMLKRRGITAFVFGRTNRTDFLLLPLILVMVYTVLADTFRLPIWPFFIRPFENGAVSGWVGLTMCLLAAIGLGLTLVSFGNSFRVGIDTDKPDRLITGGMFALSRNPIYTCALILFVGLFLVHCNVVMAVFLLIFAPVLHRQVMREERFLRSHYGAEYEAYCQKVRRYL